MKKTPKRKLTVFLESELPNMAGHRPQADCGFTLYKGVLIQWDEDEDERILILIDNMPESVRAELLVAQEHKAYVALMWKNAIPNGYEEGTECDVGDDTWYIINCVAGRVSGMRGWTEWLKSDAKLHGRPSLGLN